MFGLTPARHHISIRLTSLSGLPEGCVSPPCGFEQIESCSLYHFSKASAGRPTWQWEFPTYQYFLEVIQQQGKIIEISEISVLFYSPSSPGDKKLEGKTLASSSWSLCQESTWKCRRGRLGRMLCLKTLWLDSLYFKWTTQPNLVWTCSNMFEKHLGLDDICAWENSYALRIGTGTDTSKWDETSIEQSTQRSWYHHESLMKVMNLMGE